MSDLFVIGDSHARALNKGAKAVGFDTLCLATAAGAWRDGAIALNGAGSLISRKPRTSAKIAAFENASGQKSPLFSGTPVLASLGFDLAQLVSDFRSNKLGTYLAEDHASNHRSRISARFTRAYLQEQRGEIIAQLAQIASRSPLVVIAPPVLRTWPLQRALTAELSTMLRTAGVTLYDPNQDFSQDNGVLPDGFKHDDGKHANAAFGEAVLQAVLAKGLLPAPKQAAGKTARKTA